MRFSIGLNRLPLPQFTWASIDKQVEKHQPAISELAVETTTKEDNNE